MRLNLTLLQECMIDQSTCEKHGSTSGIIPYWPNEVSKLGRPPSSYAKDSINLYGFKISGDDRCKTKCLNSATCVDGIDSFTCSCSTGFFGNNCEFNTDNCATNECVNGATCIDGVDFYSCYCPPGYKGQYCEIDINECESNPCQNGATCEDILADFKCECVLGFDGKSCENNIDDCPNHKCEHGGTCIDGVANYTCNCVHGYADYYCETEIDECDVAVNPCNNGGTCVDEIGDYSCICAIGFNGDDCENNIDDCPYDMPFIFKNNYTTCDIDAITLLLEPNLNSTSVTDSSAQSSYIDMGSDENGIDESVLYEGKPTIKVGDLGKEPRVYKYTNDALVGTQDFIIETNVRFNKHNSFHSIYRRANSQKNRAYVELIHMGNFDYTPLESNSENSETN
jgi:hypothetical protein